MYDNFNTAKDGQQLEGKSIMSKRLDQFFSELKLSDSDICAGLTNGDIDRPSWISISENMDHLKVIDNETTECFSMGFTVINNVETFTFAIKGIVTCNTAETETGFCNVEIDECIEIDEISAQKAKNKFFEENEAYEYHGKLIKCDAQTGGLKYQLYYTGINETNEQFLSIDFIT